MVRAAMIMMLGFVCLVAPPVRGGDAVDRAVPAGDGKADFPRYRFAPGQRLVYEGLELTVNPGQVFGIERRTEMLVVAADADGSRKLVIEHRFTRYRETGGKRQDMTRRIDVYVVDVAPDGRIPTRSSDTLGMINLIIPCLPGTAREAREGWRFESADVTHDCRDLALGEDGSWTFTVEPTCFRDSVNGFSSTLTYHLDAASGLVTQIDAVYRYRGKETRRDTERLAESGMLDGDELRALAEEVDAFAAADGAYRRDLALALGSRPEAEATAMLSDALERLEAARDQLQSPVLRADLDRQAQGHKVSAERYAARVRQNGRFLGHPAPAWRLDDLQGRSHRLEDYRGRVVVLDFWYRRCGWCMRAMPQVEEVAQRFPDDRVAVLGMNTDKDEADARFIVDQVKPDYPTLLAGAQTARAHNVASFPTLFVLDQTGAIRYIQVGYTATLAADISAVVEDLLAASPQGESGAAAR